MPLLAIALFVTQAGASVTSFLSDNKLFCAEGRPRQAESALAMKKAAPIGGLFNETFGVAGANCVSRGYGIPDGPDSCSNDIEVFHRSDADRQVWQQSVHAILAAYGEQYKADADLLSLLHACTCQPGSADFDVVENQCASELGRVPGSWVHQDPWNGHEMICDEGDFVFATRSLQVLKGSPQLAMHFRDQIAPVPCNARGLGFDVKLEKEDHCYPAMNIWTRSSISGPKRCKGDAGCAEAMATESNLTSGGFAQWMQEYSLDDFAIINSNLTCNCLAYSEVGKTAVEECKSLAHSPVRDWWFGDVNMTLVPAVV